MPLRNHRIRTFLSLHHSSMSTYLRMKYFHRSVLQLISTDISFPIWTYSLWKHHSTGCRGQGTPKTLLLLGWRLGSVTGPHWVSVPPLKPKDDAGLPARLFSWKPTAGSAQVPNSVLLSTSKGQSCLCLALLFSQILIQASLEKSCLS